MNRPRADSSEELINLVWTVVVAGGAGIRFGERKQFAKLAGRSVLEHTMETVHAISDRSIVVVPSDALDEVGNALAHYDDVSVVAGGESRADSVRAGLAAVDQDATIVLVHDAARPLASTELFLRVIARVRAGAAAVIPVVPISDSIRHIDGHVVDRSTLQAVQTPQGFQARALREAHRAGADATDDASLVSELGFELATVEGEPENRKLTVPSDLLTAEAIIASRTAIQQPTQEKPEIDDVITS